LIEPVDTEVDSREFRIELLVEVRFVASQDEVEIIESLEIGRRVAVVTDGGRLRRLDVL